MYHSYFKDKISAYFDGALEAQERELIGRHLDDCAECQEILEEFKQLSETIEKHSGLSGDEYFEELAQTIEKRIAEPQEKVVDVHSFRWKSVVWKLSAAAASILLIGTIGYYQWFQDDELPERVLQSPEQAEPAEQVRVENAPETDGEFEKSSEEVAGQEVGGRKSDLSDREVANEEAVPSDKNKVESERPDIVKFAPQMQKIVLDSAGSDNAPKLTAPSPTELKETVGKTKEVQTTGGEYGDSGDETSSVDAVDKDEVARELVAADELNIEDLRKQNTFLQSQIKQGQVRQYSIDDALSSKKQARANLKSSAEAKVPDSIYQQLAVNWYQIGQITKDSVEKSQAIQYLNWYKSNFPLDSVRTNLFIKKIKK